MEQFAFENKGAMQGIIWLRGPNPPPRPPPPPKCTLAYTAATCDAVPGTKTDLGCVWCTSQDKLHALCFDKQHEPHAGAWSCDHS